MSESNNIDTLSDWKMYSFRSREQTNRPIIYTVSFVSVPDPSRFIFSMHFRGDRVSFEPLRQLDLDSCVAVIVFQSHFLQRFEKTRTSLDELSICPRMVRWKIRNLPILQSRLFFFRKFTDPYTTSYNIFRFGANYVFESNSIDTISNWKMYYFNAQQDLLLYTICLAVFMCYGHGRFWNSNAFPRSTCELCRNY